MYKPFRNVLWIVITAAPVTAGNTTYVDEWLREASVREEPDYSYVYGKPEGVPCLHAKDPDSSRDIVFCNCEGDSYPYCTTLSIVEWTCEPWKNKVEWSYCLCTKSCKEDSDCPPAPQPSTARPYCNHGACLLGCAGLKHCPHDMHCRVSASHRWTLDCYFNNAVYP